jgi:hypothetical protein
MGWPSPPAAAHQFPESPNYPSGPRCAACGDRVDFSALGDPLRLLAVAHEVGHHVYRQLTVNYASQLDTA